MIFCSKFLSEFGVDKSVYASSLRCYVSVFPFFDTEMLPEQVLRSELKPPGSLLVHVREVDDQAWYVSLQLLHLDVLVRRGHILAAL